MAKRLQTLDTSEKYQGRARGTSAVGFLIQGGNLPQVNSVSSEGTFHFVNTSYTNKCCEVEPWRSRFCRRAAMRASSFRCPRKSLFTMKGIKNEKNHRICIDCAFRFSGR